MKIIRVTYFALATLFSVASCSKEATEPDVYDWADGKIYFRPTLSDVASSRAQDMTLDKLESFQVTCFNIPDIKEGKTSPHFENATFVRKSDSSVETAFISSPFEEPHDWPKTNGPVRFFAFSPSIEVMTESFSSDMDFDESRYFKLNKATAASTGSIRYALGVLRINPDISRQFDFVTAEASGERWKDFVGGVDLAFKHQFSQVELKAWGNSEKYNFDIAGVRLGNPVVNSTYFFADDFNIERSGQWSQGTRNKGKVEYLFTGTNVTDPNNTQNVGDKIYRISSRQHNTQASAASIMGLGGCAMVIPTKNDAWEGLEDTNIGNIPYSTDKMYFSILMRVSDVNSGNVVYPYPGNKSSMTVVSYAIDSDGKILTRLFKDDTSGTYFTDAEHQHRYTVTQGVETADFGWAAVPVSVEWEAGKKYVYTLDYSEGIGLHDPEDPEPGKLIVGQSPVEWSVSVSGWDYAEENDDYTPDLDVP
ncbi:MAG: fimbrillin family protein [Muribaculaceae bacterium]|nr:fimbrillin family protein [Muribaculaceae bacterium]